LVTIDAENAEIWPNEEIVASGIEFQFEAHTVYETVLAVPFFAYVCTGTW
jgi:hypothetical protein